MPTVGRGLCTVHGGRDRRRCPTTSATSDPNAQICNQIVCRRRVRQPGPPEPTPVSRLVFVPRPSTSACCSMAPSEDCILVHKQVWLELSVLSKPQVKNI